MAGKAAIPVSISYRTVPRPQTSVAGVAGVPGESFRGEIPQRADHAVIGREGGRIDLADRDPEVGQPRDAVIPDQHVGGLDVPVHDAAFVDRRQPVGHGRRDRHGLGRIEAVAIRRQLGDRPTDDEVHHERRLVRIEDGVAHRDDVRVADRLHGCRLAAEALTRAVVGDQVRVEAFDRHDLAGALVVGAPDRGHAAHGVRFEQAVTAPEQSSIHRALVPRGGSRSHDPIGCAGLQAPANRGRRAGTRRPVTLATTAARCRDGGRRPCRDRPFPPPGTCCTASCLAARSSCRR